MRKNRVIGESGDRVIAHAPATAGASQAARSCGQRPIMRFPDSPITRYNRLMSAINGDKSRHSINRKRGVARRAKIKALVAAKKNPSTASPAPAKAASPRGGAKAR